MATKIDFKKIVPKFDEILTRGLCKGVGERDGQMCIEAAICAAMDLPHGDDPVCVADSVRAYKIGLNDSEWSSPAARAAGLRDLGIAQIGSKGVVDDVAFVTRLSELTIRHFIPALFRDVFKDDPKCLAAADECERVGSSYAASAARAASDAARAASYAARAASDAASAASYAARAASDAASDASYAASDAASAARAASYAASAASYAARAASYAARAASYAASDASYAASDKYLLLSASLALQALRELKSPGCAWLAKESK